MKDIPEDYVVVQGDEAEVLMQKVRKWLTKGYQPHGSVVVSSDKDGYVRFYVQAMVRYHLGVEQ